MCEAFNEAAVPVLEEGKPARTEKEVNIGIVVDVTDGGAEGLRRYPKLAGSRLPKAASAFVERSIG